jgi:hypothetical protein
MKKKRDKKNVGRGEYGEGRREMKQERVKAECSWSS